MSRLEIPYEQAVYGSFAFWDKGYAVLARSPGCRPEWVAELQTACQRFGERPGGVAESEVRGLFALRLASGPWMIVGVASPGSDDRGRPGALAFHALFLSPRDYRRAGCDPFAMAGALRNDWTVATRHLPSGTWTISPSDPPIEPNAAPIAAALVRGRRVAIEAAAPIDALARQVWQVLPERVRRRATLATWAFGNGNRFDLVALPRFAGVAFDASYVDAATLEGGSESPAPLQVQDQVQVHARRRRWSWAVAFVGGPAALAGVILGMWWRPDDGMARARPVVPRVVPAATARTAPAPAPDRAAYRDDPADPNVEERRQVTEALLALAERFGVFGGAASRADDPTALMILLADRLRYRGPTLSAAELASLTAASATDRAAAMALRWHTQMQRFAADRPLPDDFAQGPLRWQLDTLAWSFHLDVAGSRRSAAEVPHALGEALANDLPLPPPTSSAPHPALAAYRDFLGRLPRR